MELVLTGRMIDAAEALQIGLVSMVVKPEELMPAVTKMASTLMTKGPLALSAAKDAVHRGMDTSLPEGLKVEAELFAGLCATEDMKEGMKAFLEKRKASFQKK